MISHYTRDHNCSDFRGVLWLENILSRNGLLDLFSSAINKIWIDSVDKDPVATCLAESLDSDGDFLAADIDELQESGGGHFG